MKTDLLQLCSSSSLRLCCSPNQPRAHILRRPDPAAVSHPQSMSLALIKTTAAVARVAMPRTAAPGVKAALHKVRRLTDTAGQNALFGQDMGASSGTRRLTSAM